MRTLLGRESIVECRLRAVLGLVLTLAFGGMATPDVATAHTDACAGTAVMHTNVRLFHPGFSDDPEEPIGAYPPASAWFQIDVTAPWTCAFDQTVVLPGVLAGYCGLATGVGTSQDGHQFALLWVGDVLLLTGEVDAVFAINPDWLSADSCIVTGADRFLLAGSAVMHHCVAVEAYQPFTTDLGTVHAHACA